MYHFFVPEGPDEAGQIHITGSDVHHIRSVLRMKPGEQVVISDGRDKDYYCEITELNPGEITVQVLKETEAAELPARLILYQGLPKGEKMELIIQKAVELGACRIVPVAMKRSVVKLDEKKARAKTTRWNTIAESAAKQSGRSICPEVMLPLPFAEAIQKSGSADRILVPYENARGMQATREAMTALAPGQEIAIWIGPEGGFERSEIEALEAAGAQTISLGRRILRTETAGLTALSLCMYHLELTGEGQPEHKEEGME